MSSSPPQRRDSSTARQMVLSSKTGPWPSHLAEPFSRSHTSATSTRPCLTSGCCCMRSQAWAAGTSFPLARVRGCSLAAVFTTVALVKDSTL